MSERWVRVFEGTPARAAIVQGSLREGGVPSESVSTAGEELAGVYDHDSRASVLVPPAHADAALALLASLPSAGAADPDRARVTDLGTRIVFAMVWALACFPVVPSALCVVWGLRYRRAARALDPRPSAYGAVMLAAAVGAAALPLGVMLWRNLARSL